MAITQALDALGPDAEGLQGGAVTAAAVVTAAASTAVAFMEASLAVGSTVEDFTEDFTADFTDARLQGLALEPYADNDYYDDGGCYVVRRRVMTRYGWRVRPVQVCG
jgi:hypothetical protein